MYEHSPQMLVAIETNKVTQYELIPLWKVYTMEEDCADIELSLGQTLNTGNFTSVRCDVSLKYPSKLEDIDSTYEIVYGWVSKKLSDVVRDITEAYKGTQPIRVEHTGTSVLK